MRKTAITVMFVGVLSHFSIYDHSTEFGKFGSLDAAGVKPQPHALMASALSLDQRIFSYTHNKWTDTRTSGLMLTKFSVGMKTINNSNISGNRASYKSK